MSTPTSESDPRDQDATPTSPSDQARLRDLIAQCLEQIDAGGDAALEALLARHPHDAPFLRERLRALGAAGLLPQGAGNGFPERLGDFRLVRRLGGGGMGVVYAAVQESLRREVALKMIRPEHLYFPGARERFRREVESAARLQHPGIVPVYVVGESNGVPYYAMELVHGRSLAEVIHTMQLPGQDPGQVAANLSASALYRALGQTDGEPGELGRSYVAAVLRICAQIAEALAHAHERGVLHRDIKPSNVMLTADGRARLVDFGLATIEGAQSLTRTGHNVGSLPYMAPEQLLGQSDAVGPWTDVYGLGVTMFEALTLTSPFLADSTEATRSRILHGESPLPRRFNTAIPHDAETICLQAIRRDPRRRYQSAAELAQDLRAFLELRPVAATRPGASFKLRTWMQRHPIKTVLAVAGTVALIAGPAAFAVHAKLAQRDIAAALTQSEDNFARALSAVDELLREVGARDLAEVPQVDQVRARLLQRASSHYDAFLAMRPQQTSLKVGAVQLAHGLGEALKRLGRIDEAAAQWRRALDLAHALATQAPLDPNGPRLIASSHYGLAYLFVAASRYDDALPHLNEAVAGYRKLLAARGEERELVTEFADILGTLGNLHTRSGRLDAGLAAQEECRDALARAAAAAPDNADVTLRLGNTWQAIGTLYRLRGQLPLARSAHERAVELFAALPQERRRQQYSRQSEAVALRSLGNVLHDLGEVAAAETTLRRSIEIRQALQSEHPQVPDYRRDLGVMQMDLGEKLRQRGQVADSESELRAAIATLGPLTQSPTAAPELLSHHGMAYAQLGLTLFAQGEMERAVEAFAVARRSQETAIERSPKDPSYRLRLANVCGMFGEQLAEHGDHAAAARNLSESVDTFASLAAAVQLPASAANVMSKFRSQLGECLLRLDKFTEATAVAEALAAGDRAQRIAAAKLLARLAVPRRGEDGARAAARSIELLGALLAENRSDLAESDPAFATLRERADFGALFAPK